MALIISLSRADLLEAAVSVRLLAVYHTHSPRCHTAQPARCRDTHRISFCVVIHWFQISDSVSVIVQSCVLFTE